MALSHNDRAQIADELHNKPLQELAAVALQIELAVMAIDEGAPVRARSLCDDASETLGRALDSLRAIATDIRVPQYSAHDAA